MRDVDDERRKAEQSWLREEELRQLQRNAKCSKTNWASD